MREIFGALIPGRAADCAWLRRFFWRILAI